MSDFLIAVSFIIAGAGIGNWLGDQKTIKDCATTNKAEMMGGGAIICTVEKKSKP